MPVYYELAVAPYVIITARTELDTLLCSVLPHGRRKNRGLVE